MAIMAINGCYKLPPDYYANRYTYYLDHISFTTMKDYLISVVCSVYLLLCTVIDK